MDFYLSIIIMNNYFPDNKGVFHIKTGDSHFLIPLTAYGQ